ncbi:hypothetical protein SAMN02745161_2726 [Halodesulfovibrio marinisediminis DSM 17456]|uniref:Uncharacterized protein n=1 Tax=Halodesulfovibrio marinisediminis DSM 17456 TaxID=1121457 RepID=A0A1N6IGA3_9BACT|nr:hypothetical protein SAMN02745161_2726 [Halodesulfovibrio marinisediminis DSM 17456]
MLKRVLIGLVGLMITSRGAHIALYGHFTWDPRDPAQSKLMGVPICIFGIGMIIYAVAPDFARKIRNIILGRDE